MEDLSPDIDPGPLVANQQEVESLQRAVIGAPQNIGTLRSSLRRVLKQGAWMDRLDVNRAKHFVYTAEEFRKFVTVPIPDGGLETDDDTIRAFIHDDLELLELYEAAIMRPRGGSRGTRTQPRQGRSPRRESGKRIMIIS